jgi:hypothetical protein
VAKSAARGVRNAGGRTVTRSSGTSKTITRPAGRAKASARGAKIPRGRVAIPVTEARATAAKPAAGRGARRATPPEAEPVNAQGLSPEGQAERDQKLTALRADRDKVQQQYDSIKGLPQYATEAATFAARLVELDTQITEAAAAAGQPAQE